MDDDLTLYLEPVSEGDPCGPDLRWNAELATLESTLEQVFMPSENGAVEGLAAQSQNDPSARELVAVTRALSARTKSITVLSVHANALWIEEGLLGYARGLDALVAIVVRWPDFALGVHPRADDEGDVAERYAALARSLCAAPRYAAILGWGKTSAPSERTAAAKRLFAVFSRWESTLAVAFADDVPAPTQAWRALRAIDGFEHVLRAAEAGLMPIPVDGPDTGVGASAPGLDAWEQLDRLIATMQVSNPHSPALLLMRLVSTWQGRDVAYIVRSMSDSGLGFDVLVKAVHAQLEKAGAS